MKRLLVMIATLMALTLSLSLAACGGDERPADQKAETAQPAKSYVVSVNQFVEHPALDAVLKGFQDQLAADGFKVEYKVHNAQANMGTTNQIAQVIAGESPDLVLAIATPSAQACKQVIKKAPHMAEVPLIFSAVTDPKGAGLVDNLDAPGANVTGVSDMTPVDKHLAMIRELVPDMKAIGVVYNSGEANSVTLVNMLKEAAKAQGIEVEGASAARSGDVYQAGQSLVGRADAVYVPTDNTVVSALESLVKVCENNKLPVFAADVDSVPRGCVAALGFDYYLHGKQAGAMAARLFGGASPAATPVEFQQGLSLHLNLPAAARMGVEIPESVKAKADKIVE